MQNIIREAQRFITAKKYLLLDFAPNIHERIEQIHIKNGSGTAICDGKEFAFLSGSFFILFPNPCAHIQGATKCRITNFTRLLLTPSTKCFFIMSSEIVFADIARDISLKTKCQHKTSFYFFV